MEYLLLGAKITITRSDGRVHTAQVIDKHYELKSVMVSWSEGCKLMGKQISWDCVIALNPHLSELSESVATPDSSVQGDKETLKSSEEEFYEMETRFNEICL